MILGFEYYTVILFLSMVVGALCLDMYVHRKDSVVSLKEASAWSVFYIAIAMIFAYFIHAQYGSEKASLFLTGYTLEKVLAFDNLFVFSLIFAYFKIPEKQQHRALHWGIAGAIVFRLVFVAIGVSAIESIGLYVEIAFALLILYSVWVMFSSDDDDVDYDKIWCVKLIRKVKPNVSIFFIAILVLEVSDIMFSFDSVPAIIAVTKDPFLIYSSMIFAILGLRSMYFIISALSRYFVYMDYAVGVVLVFISGKLLAKAVFGISVDPNHSLVLILSTLTIGVIASALRGEDEKSS